MMNIEWVKSAPTEEGFYIVAVEYNNGIGTCACSYWEPNRGWSLSNEGENIVAHIKLDKIIKELPYPWDN
ncbi:hypothetical protein OLMES_4463 [Oleiphilus messinensis]|uniref:Uncharacterized protein n=1 Tax=Oleiphilus messinensis TaxID=141451 RepID=A0A1Y0IE61_9GAMM|nr:hypothetical protein [Oleiphilus messinensis]ARU58459.1 hypothetical protein OLMES_4463 [Oleiphilus messinensis]